MAAARDRTKGIAEVVRAHRHAAPIGLACGALIAGVLLLGNPFGGRPQLAPLAPQPEIHLGTAELSLPEPAAAVPPAPKPAPAAAAATDAEFVVPPAIPATAPAPAPKVPAPKQMGGGRRATIIVETVPAKPIIPPFVPKPAISATPEPHPPLPLDTEIGAKRPTDPAPKPAPKTAAASLSRDG